MTVTVRHCMYRNTCNDMLLVVEAQCEIIFHLMGGIIDPNNSVYSAPAAQMHFCFRRFLGSRQ